MCEGHVNLLRCPQANLSYRNASEFARVAHQDSPAETVVIDLAETEDTTTAALARLVVLRRDLRQSGGDLRLMHLHGRVRRLYEVNRLTNILPCV